MSDPLSMLDDHIKDYHDAPYWGGPTMYPSLSISQREKIRDHMQSQASRITRLEDALRRIADRPMGQPDTALRVVSELSLIAREALGE